MSRALDKHVKEALKNGNHQAVFDKIGSVLAYPPAKLLEIELLGQSHIFDPGTTILQDGNAVAIPKLRLVQGFIVARKILRAYIQGKHDGSIETVLRATAVILLMDPEYLTAANIRKRLLQMRIHDKDDVITHIKNEKYFVDTLLTSRLHRHTKSPTLWSHRRWLMEQFQTQGVDVTVEDDIKRVVTVSGERHPRNYYAWCHARYLISTLSAESTGHAETMLTVITVVKKWSFAHHDDISGWQFLMFLLERHQTETQPTFRETLQLAKSFRWRNESVWYFLRYTVAASKHLTDHDREEFTRVRMTLWETAAEDSQERRTLEVAGQWLPQSSNLDIGMEAAG
ncbi:hypothetical protein AK830_g744 [Neonectria ditissima]|uniref:Protein prenyltransferase alpha subunit repeat-containing protein 1 n=1 Tax=Neonectria ditissima TaxID=78410 RepID=A0A0P7BW32_9HYPO|nr:hypothetical protein AK830_g744 [Neonectria ditissima]